jgi:hypothetical protein
MSLLNKSKRDSVEDYSAVELSGLMYRWRDRDPRQAPLALRSGRQCGRRRRGSGHGPVPRRGRRAPAAAPSPFCNPVQGGSGESRFLARPGCCERGQGYSALHRYFRVNGSARASASSIWTTRYCKRCRSPSAATEMIFLKARCDRTVGNHARLGSGDFVLCAAIPFAT